MALASCALVVEVTIATQWSHGPGCAYTHAQKTCSYIHTHSLFLSVSSCIRPQSYRCPHKYYPSWFWLAHSRGGGSQLVMVLISHNALQPLAPTALVASSSIFMSPLMNMQTVKGKKKTWQCPGEPQQLTNQRVPSALDTQRWETWQETASQGL